MKLYLVRHGEAAMEADDNLRALTKEGHQEVLRMADFLARQQPTISQIYHSGKLRAEQTAMAIAEKLEPKPPVAIIAGLLPEDEVKPMVIKCNHWHQDTLLVGHLPFLGKLFAQILFEKEFSGVDFQTAAIVCLQRTAIFQWSLAWFVNPSLVF